MLITSGSSRINSKIPFHNNVEFIHYIDQNILLIIFLNFLSFEVIVILVSKTLEFFNGKWYHLTSTM